MFTKRNVLLFVFFSFVIIVSWAILNLNNGGVLADEFGEGLALTNHGQKISGPERSAAPPVDERQREIVYQTETANATRLNVLDPTTMKLSRGAISLLGFTPEKAESINKSIGAFTQKLFTEERSRAFVEVSQETGESIVVPSFDRRPFYNELKHSISQITDDSIARLLIERVSHDIRLGCVTTEIRVAFEDDQNGNPMIVFTRRVLAEGTHDPDIPLNSSADKLSSLFDTTIKMQTRAPSADASNPRIRHLVEAADRLPRRNK